MLYTKRVAVAPAAQNGVQLHVHNVAIGIGIVVFGPNPIAQPRGRAADHGDQARAQRTEQVCAANAMHVVFWNSLLFLVTRES